MKRFLVLFILVTAFLVPSTLSKGEPNLPLIDLILQKAPQFTVDDMDSGWEAVNGYIEYNTTDYVSSGSSLVASPDASGQLVIQKRFDTPINLANSNPAWYMKTHNTPLYYFNWQYHIFDSHGNYLQWSMYNKAASLVGNEEVWWNHMLSSVSPYAPENPTIDMTDIVKIKIVVLSSVSDWYVMIDKMQGFPSLDLFPHGAVVLTLDGGWYPNVVNWLEPACDVYDYHFNMATALTNRPIVADLLRWYAKGHVVCVYGRMYDESRPPQLLPLYEFTENTLGQLQWLNSLGIIVGANNLQCNRVITDVESEGLLDDDFMFVRGNAFTSSRITTFPNTAIYSATQGFYSDIACIDKAVEKHGVFFWFDHLFGTYSAAYTEDQVYQLLEYIDQTGAEVLTYPQLYQRYLTALNQTTVEPGQPVPDPLPVSHVLSVSFNGMYVIEADGVVSLFVSRDEAEAYLSVLFWGWEHE